MLGIEVDMYFIYFFYFNDFFYVVANVLYGRINWKLQTMYEIVIFFFLHFSDCEKSQVRLLCYLYIFAKLLPESNQ